MPGESVRSLRHAAVIVGALGALLLSVPISLLTSKAVFPTLHPGGHTVEASAFDDAGHRLAHPARLRPGSVAEVVAPNFTAAESVVVRSSESGQTVTTGRAGKDGVFRFRFTVPAQLSGAHSLTMVGSVVTAGASGRGPEMAVFRFVVSADQAGDR